MNEEIIRACVKRAVRQNVGSLRPDPWLAQKILAQGKEEKKMKKRVPFGLALAIVLALALTGAALAATGAFDALQSLWQDSFRRMGTEGVMDALDEPEAEAFLQEFAEEYGVKEDLVISTVPGEGDLGLEEALHIARSAIQDTFGTPETELDAMGVYPSFYKTPYMDRPPEWRFYFTPRTGENIDDDHFCPAPGEYRVYIQSPGGEVTFCHWYNDDFWPEYAQRCWDNGSRDYVYEQAQYADFLKQSIENRQHFMSLFADAGYDMPSLEKTQSDEARLRAMDIDICFAELKDDLLDSSDPFVQTAIAEMENRFGITKDDMTKCFFAAIRSPQPSETVDICFSYNFNKEAAANPGPCEVLGAGYGTRLGYFMIRMDAQSGKVVSAVNIIWDETLLPTYTDGLLSRMFWTKDDLPEYYRMMDELRTLDAGYVAGRDSESDVMNKADRVMLRYGGSPDLYTAQRIDSGVYTMAQFLYEHHLTEEAIVGKGMEYLLAHTSCSEDELKQATFLAGTMFNDPVNPDERKIHPTLLVLLEEKNGQGIRWYFQFDLELNITQFEETKENING